MQGLGIKTLGWFVLSCAFVATAHAQPYMPGEVIVKLKSPAGSEDSYVFLGKAASDKEMKLKGSWGKINMYHFGLKAGQTVEQAVAELNQDPNVEFAEPNYILAKAAATGVVQSYSPEDIKALASSDPYPATGANIHAVETWSSVSMPLDTDKPVVAVIDTGLDLNHEVFVDSGAIWINEDEIAGNGIDDDGNGYVDDRNGYNFVDGTGTMYDDDSHGTHVSGIILGVGQDIFNSPFAESKIKIMPLKFLNGSGVGSTANAIKAIYYAVNNGATILNNSWGGPTYSAALHEAVAYTYERGVTFVAAAGNAGSNNDQSPMYPASYDVPHVVSVAATNDLDYLASFSNYGTQSVHLGSPGVFILSTIPDGRYGSSSGTSMAAPFVAGIAALMKAESPNMLGYQVKQIIFGEADRVDPLSGKVYTGSRVNAAEAVDYSKVAAVSANQPSYSLSYQGNRDLASSLAGGGGCGTVAKLYSDYRNGKGGGPSGGGGPGPETWYVLLIVGVLMAPVLLVSWLRARKPQNRRRYERFKIDSEVRINLGGKELVGNVSSISLGGVQINTDALLENGGIVTMAIRSPDGEEHVQVEGRIVWSEAQKAYGVAFEGATQSALSHIRTWTKGLQKSG